ncbi:hypothetical protein J2I47_20335 [Fibrella sp. HMF5335]|uniref:Uncharacterized protein n=1 Tax=Fibrella rubiginis TaxID=2817060 RepID=A0A939GM24_9BACT|nr:hypothetical protein [Fibrella rubiginis]MBO0938912.1 hypothetical protein [Fibrella rubiginis]
MSDPLDQLTPDESLRADNEIKLLKLGLEHNVQFSAFDSDAPPEMVGQFFDSILALEEMHKNPQQQTVYDIIGQPSFQPATLLTNEELSTALDSLMKQMTSHNLFLDILAPDDYDDRTIYRFLTEELFQHETTHMGGGWNTNFIYEEFHQNHLYDLKRQSDDFINVLTESHFDRLDYYLSDSLLDKQPDVLSRRVKQVVLDRLTDLVESWWPRLLQGGSISDLVVADDTETAQAVLHLQLGTDEHTDQTTLEGIIQFSRWDQWWSIEQVRLGNWSLQP